MRKRSFFVISVLLLGLLALSWWYLGKSPTPIDELLPPDANIDLAAYDGSMSADAGAPDVMILGTSHLSQMDHDYSAEEFDRVRAALSAYEPDMVVVEYLPPDYPVGMGRDYRPSFDLERYADTWGMDRHAADSLLAAHRNREGVPEDPCRLGKAYFLTRDFVNAAYYWLPNTCADVEADEEIALWLSRASADEMVEIGFPVAREQAVRELVSFDYQGDDARWFIPEVLQDLIYSFRLRAASQFWPILPHVGTITRERSGRYSKDTLAGMLHDVNSPAHIGFEYWVYEDQYRSIEWENAGNRQTDNYWLRNERMFEYMQEAIEEQEPERVLVIVGAGHKYFLDELVREAGYRWIDPREWLPPAEGEQAMTAAR